MTRVMAHTSKVGYYVDKPSVETKRFWFRADTPEYYMYSTYDDPPRAISFKSPTWPSDGHQPTSYSRIVIRGVGQPFDYYGPSGSGYQRSTSNSSLTGNEISMSSTPWGQYGLYAGNVHPSEYLRANAISDALKRLGGNQANILEDLAQARQIGVLAGSLFKSIVQHTGRYLSVLNEITTFRSKDFGTIKGGPGRYTGPTVDGTVRGLAQAWLTWYYGVKPLISTINTLGQAQKPKNGSLKVLSKRDAVLDPTGLFSHYGLGTPAYIVEGKCREEVTCCLLVDYQLSTNLQLLANLGFHGGNPFADSESDDYGPLIDQYDIAVTAWALVPYSFVVDWILPVENFLRSLQWSPQISYKGGYVTNWMGGKATCTRNLFYPTTVVKKAPQARVEAVLFQREAYPFYPPPAVLTVNQSISPSNLASGAALLLR